MIVLTVGKNDADRRLDKFLSKTFPRLPASALYRGVRKKDIRINGKRCLPSDRVVCGDQITLYLKEEFLERKKDATYPFLRASKKLDVVYEDDNLILVDKPAGLLTHPDGREYDDVLVSRVQRYLYEKGDYRPEDENAFSPATANRLDRNTEGIVVVAKTASALRILNRKMQNREIQKYYLCIVHGAMEKPRATLTGYLLKNEARNTVSISADPASGGRPVATAYRVLRRRGNLSLLEIHLLTGRSHQIRAHLASIGRPLLGDGKYGAAFHDEKRGFSRQALCAYKLVFEFTEPAGELDYLNGREFVLSDVPFVKDFLSGRIRVEGDV